MAKIKNLSLYTLLILCAWIVVFRATHIVKNEISWDIFGYYLPLEATFIEGDMMLNDRTWVEELNQKHQLSGTLYQISSTPDNQPMYFFLFGMSIMYSGFFFIGHVLAGWLGFPQDGLSEPYAYSLVFGCMIYTLIGLYYLRKILKHFFSDQLTALLLIICVVGTNYAHHMTIKNLETTNVLFMFLAIVLWNTIQWYQHFRLKNMMAIGVSVVLMALIKPSEVLIVFLPLLWGVTSFESLIKRGRFLLEYKNNYSLLF
ncbi:MAG: glycosyltransferase family 39 protein [Crocinitomicaceae bacterium]